MYDGGCVIEPIDRMQLETFTIDSARLSVPINLEVTLATDSIFARPRERKRASITQITDETFYIAVKWSGRESTVR